MVKSCSATTEFAAIEIARVNDLTASKGEAAPKVSVGLGEILGALSYALDLTEGQPLGHSARSCIIGMHIAERIGLPAAERSALYYALLLKDAGCSSNAAKMAYLFGADDRKIKQDIKTIDWQKAGENLRLLQRSVSPTGSRWERFLKMGAMLLQGPSGPKKLVKTRCERGANIARGLGFSEATAQTILDLDEHWNGQGHPLGKRGEAISLNGRIAGLAQTFEVFFTKLGPNVAAEMTATRTGTWFEPQLADVVLSLARDEAFCAELRSTEPDVAAARYEPIDVGRTVDEALLDRIADAFAQVVDAKSPWTFQHSRRVSEIAIGMGRAAGFGEARLRKLRRSALLHDIGKLGVSNMILDKPGKLTDDEFAAMRKHPDHSERIIERVPAFAELAIVAGAHHERLDGRGYYRGVPSLELPDEARILMVADVFEALTAARPYRDAMPVEKVLGMLGRDAGVSVCGESLHALQTSLMRNDFGSRVASQLNAIEELTREVADPKCVDCGE